MTVPIFPIFAIIQGSVLHAFSTCDIITKIRVALPVLRAPGLYARIENAIVTDRQTSYNKVVVKPISESMRTVITGGESPSYNYANTYNVLLYITII